MIPHTPTRLRPGVLMVAVVACLLPGTAGAQESQGLTLGSRTPSVNIAFGGLASLGGGGVDLRVSANLPVNDRRSIELFAGAANSGGCLNTKGVYGVQFRRLVTGKESDYQAYSSFGFMGLIARYEPLIASTATAPGRPPTMCCRRCSPSLAAVWTSTSSHG